MKKFACHRLYITPNHFLKPASVTLDEEGKVTDYRTLQEETESTEWIGGILFLSDKIRITPSKQLSELLDHIPKESESGSLYAWHLSHYNFEQESPTDQSILQRLHPSSHITL